MFRFTIRDVLWLTVVVALGVAWWVDRERVRSQGEQNQQLVARFKKNGVELESMLRQLEPALTPAVRGVRVQRSMTPIPGRSDYQYPPRPPFRITDEERP